MTEPPPTRLPVTVLTGFLGSGKTTLLNALLRRSDLKDTAVIVNELGEIGLDHLLVSNSPDRTVLLNNGCLCCEMLNSFKETLADLYHRRAKSEVPPFNRVITETTGLADPAPIVQTVLRDSFVSFYFQLEGVATTVDAALGEIELNEHREAVQQAAFADTIIITKVDLTAGQPPPALHARLRQINPTATITSWHKGGAIPAALLQPGQASARAVAAGDHDHAHGHHDDDVRAESFIIDRPITWSGLAGWMDFAKEIFGNGLLRCKGLLNVVDVSGPVLVQGVRTVFASPERLGTWPDADRRSRLVCITRGVDMDVLIKSLKILHVPAGTYRPASVQELMSMEGN